MTSIEPIPRPWTTHDEEEFLSTPKHPGRIPGAKAFECSNPTLRIDTQRYYRCRRCYPCLRLKQNQWVNRIWREINFHPSTWFVTLTFRGQVPDDVYKEFQIYLRRIRKAHQRTNFRYFAITEKGDLRGREHIHAMLHSDRYHTRRSLQERVPWNRGFSKFLLVDKSEFTPVYYVAKYVTKGPSTVRASKFYGKPTVNFTIPKQ